MGSGSFLSNFGDFELVDVSLFWILNLTLHLDFSFLYFLVSGFLCPNRPVGVTIQ